MKRILAGLMAALAVLSLAACGQKAEPASLANSGAQQQTQATVQNNAGTIRELGQQSEKGYYLLEKLQEKDLFCFIDYATNTEVPLCAAPNCDHNSKECSAWAGKRNGGAQVVRGPLVLDENTLLYERYFQAGMHGNPVADEDWTELWLMDADGTNSRMVLKYANSQSLLPPFCTDGKNLYCSASEIEKNAEGIVQNISQKIIRLDLGNGQKETLWELGEDEFLGVDRQGRFLCAAQEGEKDQTVYAVDAASGQKTELAARKIEGTEDRSFAKQGDAVYWQENSGARICWTDGDANKGSVDIHWPEEITGAEDYFVRILNQIGSDLLLQVYGPWEQQEKNFLLNTQTGEVQLLTLEMMQYDRLAPIVVHADTPNGLLVTFESWPEAAPGQVDKRIGFLSQQDYRQSNRNYNEIDRTAVG